MGLIYEVCHGGIWHWLYQGNGQWGWFTVMCLGGAWLDRGYRIDLWGHAMGTHITGWIGAMRLNHGDMWHWLDQGNGVDLWRCVALAERGDGIDSGGLAIGGTRHWLDQGDGIDWWGCAVGHAKRAGLGRWDWFMGYILGTRLDRGNGIDLRGHTIGVWHWLGHVMGARVDQWDGIDFWGHAMGVRHWLDVNDEIDLWGYSMGACNWIWVMELICGGEPWGRMTLARSGWGDWFIWARHEGTSWGRDTGWIGAMELIHGGVLNAKVLYGCWIWMSIPCVLCLVLR